MSIAREIYSLVEKKIHIGGAKKPIIILYGLRQVGKTTLVKQLADQYGKEASYYNCDYPDVRQQFAYENIYHIQALIKNTRLLILDEAQRIENIGLVLKILVDEYPQVQVLATGSSSFELSNKIDEPLTGRNALINNFNDIALRDDVGALWENFCISERLKHLHNCGQHPNIFFWRTYEQKGIDYIEEANGVLDAYEFKWKAKSGTQLPKEFIDKYKPKTTAVISPENFGEWVG